MEGCAIMYEESEPYLTEEEGISCLSVTLILLFKEVRS